MLHHLLNNRTCIVDSARFLHLLTIGNSLIIRRVGLNAGTIWVYLSAKLMISTTFGLISTPSLTDCYPQAFTLRAAIGLIITTFALEPFLILETFTWTLLTP